MTPGTIALREAGCPKANTKQWCKVQNRGEEGVKLLTSDRMKLPLYTRDKQLTHMPINARITFLQMKILLSSSPWVKPEIGAIRGQ